MTIHTQTFYIGPQDGWTQVIAPGTTPVVRISAVPYTHPFFVYGAPSTTPTAADVGILLCERPFQIGGMARGSPDGFYVRVVNPNNGSAKGDGRTRIDVYWESVLGPMASMSSILHGISQTINASATTPPAPAVKTDSFTGSTVTYTVGTDVAPGKMIAKLWGAGGAGAYSAITCVARNIGAAAGAVKGTFNLVNGDVITLKVAQGGQRVTLSGTNASCRGGLGGYPDGGPGGTGNFGNTNQGAGGGGSTQVFLNGTLILTAAGGGGGVTDTGGAGAKSGEGGGLDGTTGADSSTGSHGGGTAAGGVNNNDSAGNGALLTGGWGSHTGVVTPVATSIGGGGGGGHFGGAGGIGASTGVNLAGAGGSNYVNTASSAYVASSASLFAGVGTVAGNHTDTDYANNAGRGGAGLDSRGSTTGVLGTVGDNGRSVLSFGN